MSYSPSSSIKDQEVAREFQKLAELLQLPLAGKLAVLYTAPEKPEAGECCVADGTFWNPIGDGIKRPVWYDDEVQAWKKFNV